MKRPAIFFDRDNTLIVGNEYLGDPHKVVLMNGAADAVARARALGYATVVVSNQSGVARGLISEDAVHAVNASLEEQLRHANPNAVIDRQEFCPFHPDGTVERYRRESDLRKPKPGMILHSAEKLALDLRRSWVIGDAPRDIQAGHAAGCRTILFNPRGVVPSPAALEAATVAPNYVCTTLEEAMDHIAKQHRKDPPPASSAMPEELREADNSVPLQKLERTCQQILEELKRRDHDPVVDFSISRLLAGITQILAVAILFVSYLNRQNNDAMYPLLFTAMFIQLLTIALLLMGRHAH